MATKMVGIAADMAPTVDEMIEMLNVDVLPFFDGYDEESFTFTEKYRAVAVVAGTQTSWTIALNDGTKIEVSNAYFLFPGAEKEITLAALKNTLV